jgi:hypothetical protein
VTTLTFGFVFLAFLAGGVVERWRVRRAQRGEGSPKRSIVVNDRTLAGDRVFMSALYALVTKAHEARRR